MELAHLFPQRVLHQFIIVLFDHGKAESLGGSLKAKLGNPAKEFRLLDIGPIRKIASFVARKALRGVKAFEVILGPYRF
jgi:hypothetical protein